MITPGWQLLQNTDNVKREKTGGTEDGYVTSRFPVGKHLAFPFVVQVQIMPLHGIK